MAYKLLILEKLNFSIPLYDIITMFWKSLILLKISHENTKELIKKELLILLTKFKSLPKAVYAILALSFLLHVFCLVKQPGLDGELVKVTYGANDAFNYSLTAEQLLKHGVFGYVYLEPSEVPGKNAYITPGQPLLLAGAMIISDITSIPYYYVATVINMIMNLCTVLLVFLIGKELFEKTFMELLQVFYMLFIQVTIHTSVHC